MNFDSNVSLDIIKYPLFTEKTIKLTEQNQYSFAVDRKTNKQNIKSAIEQLFNVRIVAVNTSSTPLKKRRIGKFIGKTSSYKKAIVTLAPEDSITLFQDT
jgi:large subunit ribosomal protein L23